MKLSLTNISTGEIISSHRKLRNAIQAQASHARRVKRQTGKPIQAITRIHRDGKPVSMEELNREYCRF